METRLVKFNIKKFIEDYVLCHESKDQYGEEDLLKHFDQFFWSSEYHVRASIQAYIFNNPIARQYPVLQELATKCIAIF